jgi:hypothetical protein
LFGFGEQFRFWGFASFSHAAKLEYLQFSPPLADELMQNGELPIVWGFVCLLAGDAPCGNDVNGGTRMVFREPGLFFQKVHGEKKQAAGR